MNFTEHLNLNPLVNLERVWLGTHFTNFTQQELVDFFAALSESTRLRKLATMGFSWPVMDDSTEVVARAINFLEEVDMTARPHQVYTPHPSSPKV